MNTTEQSKNKNAAVGHTPGPWKALTPAACFSGLTVQVWAGASRVADVFGSTPEQAEANARLIASAPELLASLSRLLGAFESDKDLAPGMTIKTSFETNGQAIAAARAAIAKATQS